VAAGEDTFTVADVPGLIPGASSGRGLGLQFLRHVERCAVLVHVVDSASLEPERDPLSDIDAIEHELAAYGGLEERPRLVALNKVDVPDGRALAEMVRADIEARGWPVYLVSAVTHEGLRELAYAMAGAVAQHRRLQPAPAATRVRIQPRGVDEAGFTVAARTDGFEVRGAQPERWVRQTDFDNDEAVGYLADRLARLGVEEALAAAGAHPGDAVTIAGVTFDWQPMLAAGEDEVHGVRGSDERLEDSHRPSAADRRLARDARRRASDTSEHE
jgi:GTP-binding protein